MAKLKETVEQPKEEVVITENAGIVIDKTDDIQIETKSVEEATKETSKPVSKTKVIIPEAVNAVLKNFNSFSELYVDKYNGVFSVDTKPELRGDAILYKNPYYTK